MIPDQKEQMMMIYFTFIVAKTGIAPYSILSSYR